MRAYISVKPGCYSRPAVMSRVNAMPPFMKSSRFRLSVIMGFMALVLCPVALSAATPVTILTDDAYPPYSYMQNQQAVGIYPDILRAALARMPNYALTLRPLPWRRALAQIEAGTALAVAPPYYRPVERPWMGPYSEPLLDERVVVFCGKPVFAENPRLRWPDDYHGLVFGNNFGFLPGGPAFWNAVQFGLIRVEEAPGSRANLLKLANRRVDCYLNDRLSVLIELASMQRDGVLKPAQRRAIVEGPTVSVESGFVGFTNQDNGKFAFKNDFVKKLNAVLISLRQSGEIQRIVERYFK